MARYATKNTKSDSDSTYTGPQWILDKSTATAFGETENPAVAEIRKATGMSRKAKEAAIAALQSADKAWTITLDRHDAETKAAPDRVWIAGPCKTIKVSIRVVEAIVEHAAELQKILKAWTAES